MFNGSSVVGEESQLEVRMRGPSNTEVSWEWGDRGVAPEITGGIQSTEVPPEEG